MTENPVWRGDIYVLSDEEREAVKDLASQRSSSNRRSGIPERGIGPSSGRAKDMLGMGGEWAFARLVGQDPDLTIHPRSHAKGEDDGDLAYRGRKLDVKTTDHLNGHLVVVPWKGNDPDCIYVLMVLTRRKPPTFEFMGFATPGLVQEFPSDLGHGPTFAVPQDELMEWTQVNSFLYRCREHRIVSCLDCPDAFFSR